MTTRKLPLFETRRRELELCVYCPKLCRAACPVSDADTRETVTPWGKMSQAFLLARGDVEADRGMASPAWACTGCMACRERCDHRNEVAATLGEARANLFDQGVEPAGARRVAAGFPEHERRVSDAIASARRSPRASNDAKTALLVGCGYARPELAPEMQDAIYAASELSGGAVRVVDGCCGAPLAMAGDREGFVRAAARMRARLAGATRLVVVDPGCATTVRRWGEVGVGEAPRVELLIELAASALGSLAPVAPAPDHDIRWHDPCQLGRGLGCYEPPRAILGRLLGRAPDEFPRRRDAGSCSGAGGLLPVTMPDTSRAIADGRLREHEQAGGGEVVTACASSLRRFRSRGGRASDLVSWIARGLGASPR